MHKIFSELTSQIDQAGLTDEQRKRETEAKLSELRALSIVADDWGRKAEKPGGKSSFHAPLNGLVSTEAPSGSKFQMDKIWLSSHFPWLLINPSLNSSDSRLRLSVNLSAEMPHYQSHHPSSTLKASLCVYVHACVCTVLVRTSEKGLYFLVSKCL